MDIGNVMAARDAIIQRNTALRGIAQAARADATGALARGDAFAAQLAAISPAQASRGPAAAPVAATASDGTIGSTLSSLLARVNTSQNDEDTTSDAYERGQTTDIAGVMLAGQRASLNFEATLQVRNKLLSAYKDVMSIPLG